MTVVKVVGRMYDANVSKLSKASPSENGFDEAINKAVEDKTNDKEVCVRCIHARDLNPTLVSHKISPNEAPAGVQAPSAEGADEVAESSANVSDEAVHASGAYRFSLFIRTSSNISSFGGGLVEKFKQATGDFVRALHSNDSYGLNSLDSYLGQAETVVGQGQAKTVSFIDQMMQAADKGLQAVNASMSSSSMMSGFNLSMNSALPGTSAADIAGIYLQDAFQKGSIGPSGTPNLNPGRGGGLQLIRTEDLLPPITKLTPEQEGIPEVKNQVLDKFLAMIDEMMSATDRYASPVKTEIQFSFAYGDRRMDEVKETGSEGIKEEMPEDGASEPEEITV